MCVRERASALMLMPAGVLVVLLLGAIAFDMSLVLLRQRQASSVAVDVANDLATLALDEAYFRSSGEYRIDPSAAADIGARLSEQSDVGRDLEQVLVTVLDPTTVEVRLVVGVDYVFARSIPGAADGSTVTAAATATASSGP